MADLESIKQRLDELDREWMNLQKKSITSKIEGMLLVAREGEGIPRFLELDEIEISIIEDYLRERAYNEDKNPDAYFQTDISGRSSIKIGDILLTLGKDSSYYMTKEEFEEYYKEVEEEGGDLSEIKYLTVRSIKEEEFFNLMKPKEKTHNLSEIRQAVENKNKEFKKEGMQ